MSRSGPTRSRGVRRLLLGVVAVFAVVAVLLGWSATTGSSAEVVEEVLRITGVPEADGSPVELDASVFSPAAPGPYPAVLLAHGFGGSKTDLEGRARDLAGAGYLVMTYTARGFGESGGSIHINSPDYEIDDARILIDTLAQRSDVLLDAPGDPRVGAAGGSYGGALSIMLAGSDDRIDAINPRITWNDLGRALFPQFAASGPMETPAAFPPIPTAGVFQKVWAGLFFAAGAPRDPTAPVTECGRFAADVCAAYQRGAEGGVPSRKDLRLLRSSSPAPLLGSVRAPALVMQGQSDSLFPLSEGDANVAGIAATGTPVKTVWYAGGHDGGDEEAERLDAMALAWFDRYLKQDGSAEDTAWEITGAPASLFGARTGAAPQILTAPGLPGAGSVPPAARRTIALSGGEQTVVAPAGGSPAQITTLPGFGDVIARLVRGSQTALPSPPGQSATFTTEALTQPLRLVGSATVRLRVQTDAPDAVLFASLVDVAPDGAGTVLPNRLVSPLRLTGPSPREVEVVLPAIVREISTGHRLAVVVATTDQGYVLPDDARTYRLSLADGSGLSVPEIDVAPVPADYSGLLAAAGALVAVLIAWTVLVVLRRRRRAAITRTVDPQLTPVPLVVTGLGKEYAGGFRAVCDVSFRVEPGQILGLLGPNGAGKTTVLRMLMGLIHPSEGEIVVFGHRVGPGAPVLSRLGAFVEGPGLLPFLSGRDNLELYWRATGRPLADAHMETVLEVAGLGDDADRKVKTYSQGMRQRIAIAQAMLGLPELLVLDEPTNGLDPPQIREMREVLRTYAGTGRTVVVSSHLLAEVERTCTHAVVMNRGRVVASGRLDQLVPAGRPDDGTPPANLEDVFLTLIGAQ